MNTANTDQIKAFLQNLAEKAMTVLEHGNIVGARYNACICGMWQETAKTKLGVGFDPFLKIEIPHPDSNNQDAILKFTLLKKGLGDLKSLFLTGQIASKLARRNVT